MFNVKTIGANSIIIGQNSTSEADNCLVIGDAITAKENGSAVIGDMLNGEPIPTEMAAFFREHKTEVSWLVRAIAKAIKS
jgi:hypothetical protein